MIELKKITKIHETKYSEQISLKEVNLTFHEGEFISILGPSGCGKTTLLNIISSPNHQQ